MLKLKNWSFRILDRSIQIRIRREINLEQKIRCVIPWFRMESCPLVVSLEMSIMLHFYWPIFFLLNLITGNIFTKILENLLHVVLILFLFLAGQKTTFCKNGILYSNWCKFNRFDEKKQLYIFSEYLIIGQILSNCSIRFNLFYLHKRNNNSFIKFLMLQKVATKKGWVIWSLLIKRYFDFDLKCPVLEGLFSKEKVTSKL